MAISVVGQYPKFRAWDPATKLPLVGGKLYCYAPGTTTNKAIYTTYARTVQAANPVILDANGEGLFYLDGIYDLALFDSADVPVWTVASYNDQPTSASASTTAPSVEGSPINPSFEYEGTTAGLPSNWTIFKWNTVALDTAVSFSGTKSLKFTSPGGAPGTSGGGTATSDKFITSPSSAVSIGFTIKSSAAGVHNQVQLLEYNSADALQATTTIYDDAATNPASFTTFWRTVTLGANTAWVKIYIVGAHNDSAVAGTTWVDSVEIRQAEVGGTIRLKHLTFSGSLVIDGSGLTLSSTTVNVTATGALTLQGATLAINGTTSTTATTPVLTINAATSTTVTSPVVAVNAATSTNITAPALTLNSTTSITIVTPLITSALGLVIGAATGGAKGNGTINATGLFANGTTAIIAGGSHALVSSLTLTAFGVVLGAPTGGDKGAGTLNAVNLYSNNKLVLREGTNSLTENLVIEPNLLVFQCTKEIYIYSTLPAVAMAAAVLQRTMVGGRVTSAGAVDVASQGFTSVRNSVGNYTVTWSTAFTTTPAVTATTESALTNAQLTISATSTTAFTVLTSDTGVLTDIAFSFIAIGRK